MRGFIGGWRAVLVAGAVVVGLLGCEDKGTTPDEVSKPEGSLIGDTLTYGGQSYNTVVIGGKRWMAANSNYTPPSGKSWCYDNSAYACNKYGRLYDWNTAKTVCPAGWKLPDTTDWYRLFDTAADDNMMFTAFNKLRSATGWDNLPDWLIVDSTTNETGFSALPGGAYFGSRGFEGAGYGSTWWTTASADKYNGYGWNFGDGFYYANGKVGTAKEMGYSVRCVYEY
jgi:uncharacterized protein (TIGR02145 family)